MGRREGVPDCIVIIDSSGSMTNPRYLLSHAILGAGCACEAYLRHGAQVAVYNFGDAPAGDKLLLDFTTDRKRIYQELDRKSTRLNSSHRCISYAVFCLKKKKKYIP